MADVNWSSSYDQTGEMDVQFTPELASDVCSYVSLYICTVFLLRILNVVSPHVVYCHSALEKLKIDYILGCTVSVEIACASCCCWTFSSPLYAFVLFSSFSSLHYMRALLGCCKGTGLYHQKKVYV